MKMYYSICLECGTRPAEMEAYYASLSLKAPNSLAEGDVVVNVDRQTDGRDVLVHTPYKTTEIRPHEEGYILRVLRRVPNNMANVFSKEEREKIGAFIPTLPLSIRGQKVSDTGGYLMTLAKVIPRESLPFLIRDKLARYGFVYCDFCAAYFIMDRVQTRLINPFINNADLLEREAITRLKDLGHWLKNDVLECGRTRGGAIGNADGDFLTRLAEKIDELAEKWRNPEKLPDVNIVRSTAKSCIAVMTEIQQSDKSAKEIIKQAEQTALANSRDKTDANSRGKILGLSKGSHVFLLLLLGTLLNTDKEQGEWYKRITSGNISSEFEIYPRKLLELIKRLPTREQIKMLKTQFEEIGQAHYCTDISDGGAASGSAIHFEVTDKKNKNGEKRGEKWTVVLFNTTYKLFLGEQYNESGYLKMTPQIYLDVIMRRFLDWRTAENVCDIAFRYNIRLLDGANIVDEPLVASGFDISEDTDGKKADAIRELLQQGSEGAQVEIDREAGTITARYPKAQAEIEKKNEQTRANSKKSKEKKKKHLKK